MSELTATAHLERIPSWLYGISVKLLFTVSLVLSTVMPSWSVEQCNKVPTGYSVAKAVGFMNLAHNSIERCRAARKAVSGAPCREASRHLEDADINLKQVWIHTADSRNNCWICRNTYLVSQARALAKLVNQFNQIVRTDGRYWLSGANKTIEALNTGWSSRPLCRKTGPAAPWVDGRQPIYNPSAILPQNAVVPPNTRCSIEYYSTSGRSWPRINQSSDQCYSIFKQHTNGFMEYKISLDGGGPPSNRPPGFRNDHGNYCGQVLDQIKRRCGM